ncbi:palindromic element RPE1 domain-containing protein [Rickettsia monacensis]|uniref:palindromic element RPE1 domain-containing protein n=1 Tax=Rickettsia monacensis TaxID=109232 RepID=UPI001F598DC5|nr:palindromic element RPE1 domain-containing protein [Rickettsia monacensis]
MHGHQIVIARRGKASTWQSHETVDFLHNLSYKEEFEGNTERSTGSVHLIREDTSTGLTYKLPLEGGYARSLLFHEIATSRLCLSSQ